jgi:soluble lytic murein transglycosylase-like protein
MQLMPQTAARLGVEDACSIRRRTWRAGTRYLRELLDQYGGDAVKALAAYNAGPQRVEQYGGVPPFRETRAYITGIIDDYKRKKTPAAGTFTRGAAWPITIGAANVRERSSPPGGHASTPT